MIPPLPAIPEYPTRFAEPAVGVPASAFVQPHEVPAPSTMRPLYLIRNRLEARNLWVPLAELLMTVPDKLLQILSTETPNWVDITNEDVIALVTAVGGDPAEILV